MDKLSLKENLGELSLKLKQIDLMRFGDCRVRKEKLLDALEKSFKPILSLETIKHW